MKHHQESSDIIVVKMGSESINRAPSVVLEIADIMQNTHYKVLLVTSGSVEFGRRAIGMSREDANNRSEKDADFNRRLSVYWQSALSEFYNRLMIPVKMHSAQILTTGVDLENDSSYFSSIKELIYGVWKDGNLPIINANDALSKSEIHNLKSGSDNDENARLWTIDLEAKMLAIITSTDGVYEKADRIDTRIPLLPTDSITDLYMKRISGNKSLASKVAEGKRVVEEIGATAHILDDEHSSLLEHLDYHKILQAKGHLRSKDVKGGTVIY